jgi:hypothetical protein
MARSLTGSSRFRRQRRGENRRRPAATGIAIAAGLLVAAIAVAQDSEPVTDTTLIRPPRIEVGPGTPRLAEPEPERAMEEVIVVSESEWRLPDLGSEWRREQAEERSQDRIEVSFLPLYDPENADPNVDLFPRNREMRRVGFIEIFRVRFGRRSRD